MVYRDVILADSPRVYWRLGETSGTTAQDETANNIDGSYVGSSITYGVTSVISGNTAITVANDGGGGTPRSRVDALSTTTFSDTFSFECWFKRNDTTAIERAIFEGFNWGSAFMESTGRISFAFGSLIMHSSINITDTNWHHLVITKSGSTRKIYIDSVDRTALDTNVTLSTAATTLYVGFAHNVSSVNVYGGFTYAEAAYYTTALSASQVTAHFSAQMTQDVGMVPI